MNLHDTVIPNMVTLVFDKGGTYSYVLEFQDGESFAEITQKFANPAQWKQTVFVSAGEDNIHFIPLEKVRQIYFQKVSPEKLKKYKELVFRNLAFSDGVAMGTLVPETPPAPPPKKRVRDLPKP